LVKVLHGTFQLLCLFLLLAFHILKDATIKLTVEKVPVDENSHFTFLSCEEPYQSTGLMKVEGRFVNAVQVKHY